MLLITYALKQCLNYDRCMVCMYMCHSVNIHHTFMPYMCDISNMLKTTCMCGLQA